MRVTVFEAVPTMYVALLHAPDRTTGKIVKRDIVIPADLSAP